MPISGITHGIGELIARWSALPAGAVQSLILERTALALNPRQQLFGTRSARHLAATHPELSEAVALAEEQLDAMPWAVYDVRRIFHTRGGDPTSKGHAWRSVRRLATVDRADVDESLAAYAQLDGLPVTVDEHRIPRAWHHHPRQHVPHRRAIPHHRTSRRSRQGTTTVHPHLAPAHQHLNPAECTTATP